MTNLLDQLYDEFGDNFCVFPFISAFITTFSYSYDDYNNHRFTLVPCTIGNLINEEHKFEKNTSFVDAYNSDFYVELRHAHISNKGLENPYCSNCKRDESKNGVSCRKINNEHLISKFGQDAIDIIRKVKNNNCKISIGDILDLGYMPSNYCNQACIMCFYGASSKRGEFLRKLGEKTPNRINTNLYPGDFEEILRHARILNFAGGETLIQPQVLKYIDEKIQDGTNKNIRISILTNLSLYNQTLFNKLETFQDCYMTCSIDGVGKYGEYQRIGSNWDTVANNMIKIYQNHPKIGYVINYVVTAVSVLSIPEIITWCKENQLAKDDKVNLDRKRLIFSPVRHKEYLNIDALPNNIIKNIINKLEKLNNDDDYFEYKIVINDAIKLLKSHNYNPTLNNQFKNRMLLEDTARSDGLTFYDIFENLLD